MRDSRLVGPQQFGWDGCEETAMQRFGHAEIRMRSPRPGGSGLVLRHGFESTTARRAMGVIATRSQIDLNQLDSLRLRATFHGTRRGARLSAGAEPRGLSSRADEVAPQRYRLALAVEAGRDVGCQ